MHLVDLPGLPWRSQRRLARIPLGIELVLPTLEDWMNSELPAQAAQVELGDVVVWGIRSGPSGLLLPTNEHQG